MLTADAQTDFVSFAIARGLDLERLGAIEAVDSMCEWYQLRRVDDVTLEDDGDMLLFQWGSYPWDEGAFSYDITRQLAINGAEDDDGIFQLSLTVLFHPTGASAALGRGDKWCSRPGDLLNFRSFIASSPATAIASSHQRSGSHLTFHQAG